MQKESKSISLKNAIVFAAILLNAIVLKIGFINDDKWYWVLLITIPLLLISFIVLALID